MYRMNCFECCSPRHPFLVQVVEMFLLTPVLPSRRRIHRHSSGSTSLNRVIIFVVSHVLILVDICHVCAASSLLLPCPLTEQREVRAQPAAHFSTGAVHVTLRRPTDGFEFAHSTVPSLPIPFHDLEAYVGKSDSPCPSSLDACCLRTRYPLYPAALVWYLMYVARSSGRPPISEPYLCFIGKRCLCFTQYRQM